MRKKYFLAAVFAMIFMLSVSPVKASAYDDYDDEYDDEDEDYDDDDEDEDWDDEDEDWDDEEGEEDEDYDEDDEEDDEEDYSYYTIEFDGNGATSGSMDDIDAEADTLIKLPKNAFVKKGYIFKGWKYNIEDVAYTIPVTNLTIQISEDVLYEYEIDYITLYAQWEKEPVAKKKGSVITDKKSAAKYIVTSSNKNNPTVKYSVPTNKNATSIAIPASITSDGITYKVTEVGKKALAGKKKVKKVTMGNNVVKIGDEAFSGCTGLGSVKIGANVTTIGTKAFYQCSGLKELTIPANVKILGKQFIGKCVSLNKLSIKSKNLTGKTVAALAFAETNKTMVVKVPKSSLNGYTKLFQKKGLDIIIKVKAGK